MNNQNLGKYEIIERLGRGGMAEVYRAYHASLDRYVAVKVLHNFLADDPEFKNRFEKEAQNIARLKHPNIVQVYDFDFDPASESYYMVMELIEGVTLTDRLDADGQADRPLETTEALRIIREAASALAYAHRAGMIHRDVKPGNLMLDKNDDDRVVLTDFGIAKLITSAKFTVTGGLIGTPAYMAPEQGVGETGDERADLYSLGVILYQMVTGKLPYKADTPLALILKHLNDPIPSAVKENPQLPPEVDHIIARLLAKEVEDRYQTAGDIIDDIERLESNRAFSGVRPEAHKTASETLNFDYPTPVDPSNAGAVPDEDSSRAAAAASSGGNRRGFIGLVLVLLLFVVVLGGYTIGANNGVFPALAFMVSATPEPSDTPAPTVDMTETALALLQVTDTPEATATETPTSTSTNTNTPTMSPTSTHTATSTATRTPTITSTSTNTPVVTATMTPNMTATLAAERTSTAAACDYDYAIIEQTPEDGEQGGFFRANTSYERTITFLNTGNCPWERNTSLTFINSSGVSFNAGPRIFIREPVDVGEEVELIFRATLPARGSVTPLGGSWQLRTPGQIAIGDPMIISILVFESN